MNCLLNLLMIVGMCQFVEEKEDNETSGKLGAALLGTLVRESQVRVP